MVAKRLLDVPLFEALGKHDREAVSRLADELDVPEGRVLIREGDIGHEFFVIQNGSAEVTHDGYVVAELGPGEYFGEMALLDEDRRTATVTATSESTVIVINGPAFRGRRYSMPTVLESVREEIERRRAAGPVAA